MKKIYVVLTNGAGIVRVKEFVVTEERDATYYTEGGVGTYEKYDDDVFTDRNLAYSHATGKVITAQKALAMDVLTNARNLQELLQHGLAERTS